MSSEGMEVGEDNSGPENENCWRGHSMEQIYRGLSEWELKNFPEVKHAPNHTVLFHLPVTDSSIPPKPYVSATKWDANHVRLPYAVQNQYVVKSDYNIEEVKCRWTLIQTALTREFRNSYDLEKSILSYNTKYLKTWKFNGLHKLFEDEDEAATTSFFNEILPGIIRLALALPQLVPASIPLLKRGTNKSISFSQQQISSLLANAFLCTFPRRNAQGKRSEYRSFPDINFNRLFQSCEQNVIEKLKCICNYFRRVCRTTPVGVVTFIRRSMSDAERIKWDKWGGDFQNSKLHVSSNGTIEDQGRGLLQVDFANKYLGGGVLGKGCVQEEIRFVICPEMIVSKLITEVLDKNEALFMIGCERFSDYTGYASSFEFNGNFNDDTPTDESKRKICSVVAIDALNFYSASDQYKEELLRRELDKAYVGCFHCLSTPAPGLATGNWGCGAFGGNKRLKALLQLMVCCVTCRPMVYYTFCDKNLRDELIEMFNFLVDSKITVAELWASLVQIRHHKVDPKQIYSFIYQWHRDIKYSRLLLDDSPNFDKSDYQSTTESLTKSSNSKWEWNYQKDKSISSSSFYNSPNVSSKIEESRQTPNTYERNLEQKSRSNTINQEYYGKHMPKESETTCKSLIGALDEDYGIRQTNQITAEHNILEKNSTPDTNHHIDESGDMFADFVNSASNKSTERINESTPKENDGNEGEETISCTSEVGKSLKRKVCENTKQLKITDLFSK